jgi:hypothetical protein
MAANLDAWIDVVAHLGFAPVPIVGNWSNRQFKQYGLVCDGPDGATGCIPPGVLLVLDVVLGPPWPPWLVLFAGFPPKPMRNPPYTRQ